jgi:hypothetical protein
MQSKMRILSGNSEDKVVFHITRNFEIQYPIDVNGVPHSHSVFPISFSHPKIVVPPIAAYPHWRRTTATSILIARVL